MGKVISLIERMEMWDVAYVSPDGKTRFLSSNHGRFKLLHNGIEMNTFDVVDAVDMLSSLSSGMEKSMDLIVQN